MQATEFDKLASFEGWYWWYRAQRANLVDAVRHLPLPKGARVLDAGCGTGRNLTELARCAQAVAFGIDVSPQAVGVWRHGRDRRYCQASINELPYSSQAFDVVTSVDVLQEKSVDPRRAVREMSRVLRIGGHLILLAPAYQWMLSRHDRAVDSVRRFTRRELNALIGDAGLSIEKTTYRFGVFFPVIASKRLWNQILSPRTDSPAASDLAPIPRWMNAALSVAARIERGVARRISLPFGSTILLIARKGAQ